MKCKKLECINLRALNHCVATLIRNKAIWVRQFCLSQLAQLSYGMLASTLTSISLSHLLVNSSHCALESLFRKILPYHFPLHPGLYVMLVGTGEFIWAKTLSSHDFGHFSPACCLTHSPCFPCPVEEGYQQHQLQTHEVNQRHHQTD